MMLQQIHGAGRVAVGAGEGYDTKDFVAECRHMNITPQVAQNVKRNGGRCHCWPHDAAFGVRDQPAERKRMKSASDD